MEWFCFYLIPAAVAWKKRKENPGCMIFSLFNTMLGAFLAVWCESRVAGSITALLPAGHFCRPWIACGSILIVWLVSTVAFNKIQEMVIPQGLDTFDFPEKASKILSFTASFFNVGLICALLLTALAISPVSPYVPFIVKERSLYTSARFRILCNTFFVDRLSWQKVSINQRRRAFDRFIPENPGENGKSHTQKNQSRKAK